MKVGQLVYSAWTNIYGPKIYTYKFIAKYEEHSQCLAILWDENGSRIEKDLADVFLSPKEAFENELKIFIQDRGVIQDQLRELELQISKIESAMDKIEKEIEKYP